jgi:hypothetical protein
VPDTIDNQAEIFAEKFVTRIKDGTLKRPIVPNNGSSVTKEYMAQVDARYEESVSSDAWKKISAELQ